MKTTISLTAIVLLYSSVATAQRTVRPRRVSADSAYALRIYMSADSSARALSFLQDDDIIRMRLGTASPGRAEYLGLSAMRARSEIAEKAKDFDATSPPAGLDRVHEQIMEALHHLSGAADSLGRTSSDCLTDLCRLSMARSLVAVLTARNEYDAARVRAQRLLADKEVALAPAVLDLEEWQRVLHPANDDGLSKMSSGAKAKALEQIEARLAKPR
jgi:hypothetical protein